MVIVNKSDPAFADWPDHFDGKDVTRKEAYKDADGNPVYEYFETVTDINEVKKSAKEKTKAAFNTALAVGFTCSNGIKMDADRERVQRLDDGTRLAKRLGQTTMNVRDFNNVTQPNVPVADVEKMVDELGANYLAQLEKKWALQDQIEAATTIAEVEAIKW